MTCGLALICNVVTVLGPVHAQTKKSASVAPSQFLGKSFDECEKILGKPGLIANPEIANKRSEMRYYTANIPGITRIILRRVPEGSVASTTPGPLPKTVKQASYQFPKGKVYSYTKQRNFEATLKSLIQPTKNACKLIGVSAAGIVVAPYIVIDDGRILTPDELARWPGLFAFWIPADQSRDMKMPEYRHESEDELAFRAHP